jgi:hypothetical protein
LVVFDNGFGAGEVAGRDLEAYFRNYRGAG